MKLRTFTSSYAIGCTLISIADKQSYVTNLYIVAEDLDEATLLSSSWVADYARTAEAVGCIAMRVTSEDAREVTFLALEDGAIEPDEINCRTLEAPYLATFHKIGDPDDKIGVAISANHLEQAGAMLHQYVKDLRRQGKHYSFIRMIGMGSRDQTFLVMR